MSLFVTAFSKHALQATVDRLAPIVSSRGESVALNPQPLPPVETGSTPHPDLGEKVALNPQPLPPRWLVQVHAALLDVVALNPQPLPPRAAAFVPVDDVCGTVVGRHPPLPRPGTAGG